MGMISKDEFDELRRRTDETKDVGDGDHSLGRQIMDSEVALQGTIEAQRAKAAQNKIKEEGQELDLNEKEKYGKLHRKSLKKLSKEDNIAAKVSVVHHTKPGGGSVEDREEAREDRESDIDSAIAGEANTRKNKAFKERKGAIKDLKKDIRSYAAELAKISYLHPLQRRKLEKQKSDAERRLENLLGSLPS
jgi:hypothetical protein